MKGEGSSGQIGFPYCVVEGGVSSVFLDRRGFKCEIKTTIKTTTLINTLLNPLINPPFSYIEISRTTDYGLLFHDFGPLKTPG